MKRILNWRPSFKHHLDERYKAIRSEVSLPTSIDLRTKCTPVFDQGQMGSCSGNALAGAHDFLTQSPIPSSRLFIYYNERLREGDPGEDAGATTLRDGCVVLWGMGVCSEEAWDYSQENLLVKPTQEAYREAMQHKNVSFAGLHSMQERKYCLASGKAFVFGIPVFDSFMSDQVSETGLVPMPEAGESVEGGHALMMVGYDDASQLYLFRNSWGSSWADGGYGYLPYDYVESMGDDFFTLSLP